MKDRIENKSLSSMRGVKEGKFGGCVLYLYMKIEQ
jgi:hypothetical protein